MILEVEGGLCVSKSMKTYMHDVNVNSRYYNNTPTKTVSQQSVVCQLVIQNSSHQ